MTGGQVFLSTKNGYLAPDAEHPHGPDRYVEEELFDNGVITSEDIVDSSHCMTKKYLSHELHRSLANIQLSCIDLLYLHNAAESQIPAVGKREFIRRLREAFSFFEGARKEGKIKFYGMATRAIYLTNYKGDDGKPKVGVNIISLKSPNYWHLEFLGEENDEIGHYRLKSLGKNKTRLDMTFTEKWKVTTKIPTKEEMIDGSGKSWDKFIAALEKDYNSKTK